MDRNDLRTRHGLITGDVAADRTAALKTLAESFSTGGIPVFLTDTEGDLENLSESFPVQLWDLYGQHGHPVRTTVSEMGSILLARVLDLNETQAGVLNIAFRIADEKGMHLLDIKDLRAMLQYIGENRSEFTLSYGNISKQTVGAILRSLISLENQGGSLFFGEPALDVTDWASASSGGSGVINILHSVRLCQSPALYSAFLLWMLSELCETLPETENSDQMKFVFFFSAARLLFRDNPAILLDKIEQVVRQARLKGIGIYFITEKAADLPPNILNLLENRIVHSVAEPGKPGGSTDTAESEKSGKLQSGGRDTRDQNPGKKTGRRGYTRQTPMEKAVNAVFSTIGREVGRTLIRGILGSLKK